MNLVIRQTASYVGVSTDGDRRWDWSVWIDGPDAELDQVESVEWVLHETFPQSVVPVTQRQSKFRLDQNGWGEFEINAYVKAKDGPQHLVHWLRLAESGGPPAQPAPTRGRTGRGGKGGVKSSDIFVSYRRKDSSHFTGRLCDRLIGKFGEGQVFFDTDAIEPGAGFPQAITDAVASCKVLLAIIGPDWLTATDELGRRRIEDANNYVRREIEDALDRNVPIIPILMDDTAMPRGQDLPGSLAGLVTLQASIIRSESFPNDTDRLVAKLQSIILNR